MQSVKRVPSSMYFRSLRNIAPCKHYSRAFHSVATPKHYDVFIIGGGVTGAALLYDLASFTNVHRLGLVEKRQDYGLSNSGPHSNSQTIHCGDIETLYSMEKARKVKRDADLLRNYLTQLPPESRDKCVFKMQKMVLGVGDKECDALERRYRDFNHLYPRMELLTKKQLEEVEPRVALTASGNRRLEPLAAIFVRDEHSAANYSQVSRTLIADAKRMAGLSKLIDTHTNVHVSRVQRDGKQFRIETSAGPVTADFLVAAACGYSLLFAHQLGYAPQMSSFPVVGNYYMTREPILRGKVYTVQDERFPFISVHADPDIQAGFATRFGPTTLPVPFLEKFNKSSFFDYLKVMRLDYSFFKTMLHMGLDSGMRRFGYRMAHYQLPYFGNLAFLKDAQKLVPSLQPGDLLYASYYGGIQPKILDKEHLHLSLTEDKLEGENAIFNVTPSPGATTCLGNAERDMRTICAALGASIDEQAFKETLCEGAYPIDYI